MNEILKTLLYEWQDRELPEVTPRDIKIDTSKQPGVNNATVITGFRRVGKTYMVFETIKKLLKEYNKKDVIYINFEDERILPQIDILTDLLPEIQATYGQKPKFLFLDEIQVIPNWGQWVRRMLDTYEDIQIFITGSSSKMGSNELPTELRGRAWVKYVSALSFDEFLRFKGESIDSEKMKFIADERARFKFLFDEYLKFGGLPAVVLVDDLRKQELLQSYFQTVVQKEVCERNKINNSTALKTLLKLLLNSQQITISKLFNSFSSLGIPVGKTTIDNYLGYIEDSYFMKQLSIFSPKVVNQLNYARKIYFIDTGFITALSTKFSHNMGRLFENVVYNKLAQKHDTLHYYRDDRNYEVDFVALENTQVSAMYQVCYSLEDEDTLKRETRSLLKAGANLNCTNLNLILVDNINDSAVPKEIKVLSIKDI